MAFYSSAKSKLDNVAYNLDKTRTEYFRNVRNNIWGGFLSKDHSTLMKSDPYNIQYANNKDCQIKGGNRQMKQWIK